MHNHLVQFLTTGNKLSQFQHGFCKGHSCQTQLLETVHEWALGLDGVNSTHVIFTDFSKAFDSVPHGHVLLKLEQIGIRGNIHAWISNFLVHRRQRVLLDGSTSEWTEVTSGVPQGSILGPLLFTSMISLATCPHLLNYLQMTAQSTAIISSSLDCDLQEDLIRLFRWCQKWQFPLNTKKCKVMGIFLKKKPPSYTYSINNNTLEIHLQISRYHHQQAEVGRPQYRSDCQGISHSKPAEKDNERLLQGC